MALEEGWQHDFLTQCVRIFINGEAGTVRCNLEKHAVRLSEIKTAEPVAIDLAAVGNAKRIQPFGPRMVLFLRGRTERHVMHTARTLARHRQVGLRNDM